MNIIKQDDVVESECVCVCVWGASPFIRCSGKDISEWIAFDLKVNIKKESPYEDQRVPWRELSKYPRYSNIIHS